VAIWPHPFCGQSRVSAALLRELGERLLPLSSYTISFFILHINTGILEGKWA